MRILESLHNVIGTVESLSKSGVVFVVSSISTPNLLKHRFASRSSALGKHNQDRLIFESCVTHNVVRASCTISRLKFRDSRATTSLQTALYTVENIPKQMQSLPRLLDPLHLFVHVQHNIHLKTVTEKLRIAFPKLMNFSADLRPIVETISTATCFLSIYRHCEL